MSRPHEWDAAHRLALEIATSRCRRSKHFAVSRLLSMLLSLLRGGQ